MTLIGVDQSFKSDDVNLLNKRQYIAGCLHSSTMARANLNFFAIAGLTAFN
jgi:hypothetical protein